MIPPSKIIRSLARRSPATGRLLLRTWLRLPFRPVGKPHWLLVQLSRDLNQRLVVAARLGNGMPIAVFGGDFVSRKILRNGYYEPETVALVEQLLTPGMTFVDAGAHCGQYTLVAARQVGPAGQVHSFEPDPQTFAILQKNIAMNKLGNVHANQVALAERVATLDFFLGNDLNFGANSLAPNVFNSNRAIKVSTRPLDDYLQEQGVEQVDLVKIDVEGAELAVLQGSRALLSGRHRPFIIAEFNEEAQQGFGTSCAALAGLLQEMDYLLYRVGPEQGAGFHAGRKVEDFFNVLAVPQEKISRLPEQAITLSPEDSVTAGKFTAGVVGVAHA